MVSVVELKRRMANASILGIIISKLCNRKKLCSVILLKVDKNLEISFYYTILLFDLTVCLWVEGGRESPLNAEEII